MDFSEHVIVSAAGSGAILAAGAGLPAAAAFGLMGVFIDLDHFPDYWRETGLNFDIPRFMGYFSSREIRRLVVVMHAWEWILAGFGLALWLGAPAWVFWGLAGWLLHLGLDQRFNYLHPLAYFFSFRARQGFDEKKLHG